MRQREKKAKNSIETLADRVKKIELGLKKIESQLKQKEPPLKAGQKTEFQQRISVQITELQNQIRERVAPEGNFDGLITLEEGYAVDLEALEKKMEEKYSLLAARERELQDLQKRISMEFENLKAKTEERDLFLAAKETEIKSLKPSMGSREEWENLTRSQAGKKKRAARLVSFLVDIGKKN